MSQSNTPAQQLYDLLVAHDFEPETLDASGKPADDPAESDIISFDYKTENKDYGTVVIVLDQDQNLDVYFGDNLGRSMETDDRSQWYDFLYLLRMFAKRNLMTFGLKNLSRLKFNMKTMAAVKEGLFEGYYGNKKVSYSDQPQKTRLVIKHNKTLGEDDARFRYIESIFVETEGGERFKVPSKSLTHGRMLARHIAEGGNPYDAFGQHINDVVSEIATLSSFIRSAKHKNYDGDASHMVEQAVRHYQALKSKAKRIISRRGYHSELESFDPSSITPLDETIETVRELFMQQSLDPRVEQALPVLAKLQATDIKEADQFESWADNVMEGTWALPNTPEAQSKLKELMSKELIVGPDATNATEQLYDIVGDDELFDILDDLAKSDPNANAWDSPKVISRLRNLGIDITGNEIDEAYGRRSSYYNPLDQERREQDAMDWDKRNFKRQELEHELAGEEEYWKEKERTEKFGTWYIRINGKLLKDKQGNPYTFKGKAAANKAAITMMAKPFNKDKEFRLTTSPTDRATEAKDMCNVCGQTPCNCTHLTENVAVGTKLDLSKNWGNFSALHGVVKDLTPSGKLKIQIVKADPVPGKKVSLSVGDVVTMAQNYVKKSNVVQETTDELSRLRALVK